MKFRSLPMCAGIVLAAWGPFGPAVLQPVSYQVLALADNQASADLAKAIRAGDLDAVETAVAAGADLNALDSRKMPPIGVAILMGKVDIVEFLASKGADVNRNDGFGFTPLMCAAIRGQSGAAKALLKAGADPTLKGESGNDPITVARPKGPADPLLDGKAAVMKILTDAIDKTKPAPALTASQPAQPPTAVASTKVLSPAAALPAAEEGVFDDLQFKTPSPKVWKAATNDNNLIFSSDVPAPDFCTITVFASRDLVGDSAAFAKAFDAAVAAELKVKGVIKIEKDTGASSSKTPAGGELLFRRLYCEAKDFHTCNTFLGIHSADRFEFVGYQSSGQETYDLHSAEVQKFFESLKVQISRTVDAPTPVSKEPARPEKQGSGTSGLGGMLHAIAPEPPPVPIEAIKGEVQLTGLYIRQQSIMWANGRTSLEYTYYYFFPDGHLFMGIPPADQMKAEPAANDFTALQKTSPKQCGSYQISGDQITLHMSSEKPRTLKFAFEKPGDVRVAIIDGLGAIKIRAFKNDDKLKGSYSRGIGSGQNLSVVETYTFNPDGSVRLVSVADLQRVGGSTTSRTGTYKLSDNLLSFTWSDGKNEAHVIYPFLSEDVAAPEHIGIDGAIFMREKQ